MKKSAEAAIEKPISDAIAKAIEEAKADSDLSFLKKQKPMELVKFFLLPWIKTEPKRGMI